MSFPTLVKDRNEQWWKCNDGDVTQATWNDVCNDSYGGGLSSAYSLIYQSQEQFDLDTDTPDEELEPDQNDLVEAHDNAASNPTETEDDVIMVEERTKETPTDNTGHYMEIDSSDSLHEYLDQLNATMNAEDENDMKQLTAKQATEKQSERNYRLKFSNFCDALLVVDDNDKKAKEQKQDLIMATRYSEIPCPENAQKQENKYQSDFMRFTLYKETRRMFNHYFHTYQLLMAFDISWTRESEGFFVNSSTDFFQITKNLGSLAEGVKNYWNFENSFADYAKKYNLAFVKSNEQMGLLIQLVLFLIEKTTAELCIMMEQMSLEEEKAAFKDMDGYLFCFLFLSKIAEDTSLPTAKVTREQVSDTIEKVRDKWCSYIGADDKIKDEEGLRILVESLLMETNRFNTNVTSHSLTSSTVQTQTALMEKFTKFLTEIELSNDSMSTN